MDLPTTYTVKRCVLWLIRHVHTQSAGVVDDLNLDQQSALFCSLISTSNKWRKTRFILLFCLHYRCMLNSTDLQLEIKPTFRPWFIYDCAIWALRTLEMQTERLRNFVSRWELPEHFNLTVSRSLTPPDATRRNCRATVSSFNVFRFSKNVSSLAVGVIASVVSVCIAIV